MIKKATKKYIREIAKLMLEEFKKPPFNEKSSFNAVLKSLNFYFRIGKAFVAVDDKRIVGVVVFKIEQYWEGPVMIIEDLAVKEDFKRVGVGKELMKKAESYAKKNKIRKIHFSTHRKSPAVRFYKRQGYGINRNVVSMGKRFNYAE